MIISEFIEKTGFTPTDNYYYTVIEPEYMASGEIDKDKWCKQWKKNGGIQNAYDALRKQASNDSANVLSLENEVKNLREELSRLKEMNNNQSQIIQDEREKVFQFGIWKDKLLPELLEISERYSSAELREIVINEIGFKNYISYKFEHDMAIWQLDRDRIIENLK